MKRNILNTAVEVRVVGSAILHALTLSSNEGANRIPYQYDVAVIRAFEHDVVPIN